MKRLLAFIAITLLLAGCKRDNNPVDSGFDSIQSEAAYSELSMYNTAVAKVTATGTVLADSGGCVHDSIRNIRMLDSLKAYLSLSDDQFVQLQQIGTTLFTRLREIRTMVKDSVISRDSAKVLVAEARTAFVTSVNTILTANQQTLFAQWIELYWNKPRGGHGGHGGPGGHHGHGGPGGNGGGKR